MSTVFLNLMYIISIMLIFHVSAEEVDEIEDGSFLFSSMYEEFCEADNKPPVKGSPCQDEKLMSFLASLQVVNPESVIALAIKNKLHKLCANTSKTIEQSEKYLKSCTLQPGQDVYNHLLGAISTLHKKLCTRDHYRNAFMQFKNCFSQLQSEFDSCNGPADWSDNSNVMMVCKAYQEIADCYYIKTSVLCGNKAADVFKELVNAVVDSVITVDCSKGLPGSLGRANKNLSSIESSGVGQSKSERFPAIFILSLILIQSITNK